MRNQYAVISTVEVACNKFGLENFLPARRYFEVAKKLNKNEMRSFLEKAVASGDDDIYVTDALISLIDLFFIDGESEKRNTEISNYLEKAKTFLKKIDEVQFPQKLQSDIRIRAIEKTFEVICKEKEHTTRLIELQSAEGNLRKREEDINRSILRKRIDLEYALNKSAIEELGYDDSAFYREVDCKVYGLRGINEKLLRKLENGPSQFSSDEKSLIHDALDPVHFDPYANFWKNLIFRRLPRTVLGLFQANVKRNRLNYVLPTLRASYLGEWKEFLMAAGRILTGDKFESGKAEFHLDMQKINEASGQIRNMVDRFDEILKNDQERSLRGKVFFWLLVAFAVETAVVFSFASHIAYIPEMRVLLNILIPATLLQITAMVFYVVKSLFPQKTGLVDRGICLIEPSDIEAWKKILEEKTIKPKP